MRAKGFREAGGKAHFEGHRERLRERFSNGGADALPDYELLELILFRVFPRGDTKPIAKALIGRFGNFAEVVSAPPEVLREVDGVGERVVQELKLVQAAALRLAKGEMMDRSALSSWTAVLDYCRAAMAYETREQFRMSLPDPSLPY